MNPRAVVTPSPAAELYSPQRRTALVLTGTGTAGAYHAGVLRALHEAGVKLDILAGHGIRVVGAPAAAGGGRRAPHEAGCDLDIVAGHGIGVVGALFAAVDGAQHLWDDTGFWR